MDQKLAQVGPDPKPEILFLVLPRPEMHVRLQVLLGIRRKARTCRDLPQSAAEEQTPAWRPVWFGTGYIRSGALIPISSSVRRKTIWADSTSLRRARVMSWSLGSEEMTRQFS